jgi:hypothetical protein
MPPRFVDCFPTATDSQQWSPSVLGFSALLVTCLLVAGETQASEQGGLPRVSCQDTPLNTVQRSIEVARRELTSAPSDAPVERMSATATPAGRQASAGDCVVFLAASDGRSTARVAMGRADDLVQATLHAAKSLRARTGSAAAGEPPWILLSVVESAGSLEDPQLRALPNGLYGLLEEGFAGRFLLPAEVLTHRIVDSSRRYRAELYAEFAQKFPLRSPHGGAPSWAGYFTTQEFFSAGSEVVSLYRGQRRDIALTNEELLVRAAAAGAYLARSVNADGSFEYVYLPKSDRRDDGYNLLRHAGAVFALFQLHHVTREAQFLSAGERAVSYLLEQIQACPGSSTALCAVEDGETKLGGNGLAILALLEHPQISQRQDLSRAAVGLGERILEVQRPDGSFWPHKASWPSGKPSDFVSEYYPGEAIFALTRLHRLVGEERWLAAARRAASFRVESALQAFEGGAARMTHDHWLAYGLAELAELRPEAPDALYLRRLARSIAEAQLETDPLMPLDWRGGFFTPPRSAPVATRAEALAAILRVLPPRGSGSAGEQDAQLGEIGASLCAALGFQLRTQFTPERALFLADPQRALGGISRGLTDFSLRIDYAQHTISSLLAAIDLQASGRLTCPALDLLDPLPTAGQQQPEKPEQPEQPEQP